MRLIPADGTEFAPTYGDDPGTGKRGMEWHADLRGCQILKPSWKGGWS